MKGEKLRLWTVAGAIVLVFMLAFSTACAKPAPASFSLSNLAIQPVEAQPGEAVTVTVEVANTGGTEGSYTVTLMINGVKEADKSVTLAAGGTQMVTFVVTKQDAISYNAVVDGLSASFSVVAPPPTPMEELTEVLARAAGVASVKYDLVTIAPGQPEMREKVWEKGDKMRREQVGEGQTDWVYIWDPDTQTQYFYNPADPMNRGSVAGSFGVGGTLRMLGTKVVDVESLEDPTALVIGSETVDGKNCLVVEFEIFLFETSESVKTKWWIWKDYGLPIRNVTSWPGGEAIMEFKNIEFVDVPDSMFELPPGVKTTPASVSTPTFLAKWGTEGSGDGQFSGPSGIAVDSAGNVYVVENGNDRVQKFSPDGAFLAKWGTKGSGDGQFIGPMGIAVDGTGNVYVVDAYNHRVQKFSSDGEFLAKWGTEGSGDGQFSTPNGIAVDGLGNVYVTELYNLRVQKFSSAGVFLAKWGTPGRGDGQFSSPEGIAVDGAGNVYVVDAGNNRVQKFR